MEAISTVALVFGVFVLIAAAQDSHFKKEVVALTEVIRIQSQENSEG